MTPNEIDIELKKIYKKKVMCRDRRSKYGIRKTQRSVYDSLCRRETTLKQQLMLEEKKESE